MRTTCIMAVGLVVLVGVLPMPAQVKHAITARDCVTVRDLQHDDATSRSTIKISPDGSRVAYPVKSPNLQTNNNEIELFVRRLPTNPENSGNPIVVGDLSAVRWLPDSRHLTMLMKENGRRALEELDSVTGDHHVLLKAEKDITEYSVNRAGNIVVYATEIPLAAKENGRGSDEIATGYWIPFQRSANALWPREQLFLTRQVDGVWSVPKAISITSPLNGQPMTELTYGNLPNLNPALSPDGKKLLISYYDFSENMSDEWRKSGYMQFRNTAGVIQAFHLLVLYDLDTKETTVPLKTPWVVDAPHWSQDGSSFVAVARAPIGSELERESLRTGTIAHSAGSHLFRVEPGSGKIEDVVPKLAYPWGGPLFWDSDGDLLVQVSSLDKISRYSRRDGNWREVASWQIPLRVSPQVATDGKYVIGDFNDTTTPPQLFAYRPGDKQAEVFAKLNPQFDNLTLAAPQEVHWKTATGFDASGLLLLPPNYVNGKRYPLVIHTKPFGSFFVCSYGNFPSFAPQPIANAGIMYLGLGQLAPKETTQREEDYFPKGYPGYQGVGGVAEAAFEMDLWDSAVKSLDEQGLVDSNKVGIIGFSRTGWYTEFILAHSKRHYRAATVADNVQYSLGEYWLSHDSGTLKTWDQTYGGPPYGATLKNWLDYSISFNLDKIHAPLLMEEMGNGVLYDNPAAPPLGLATAFEVFTGLNRLKKPAELYYYPNEDHTPYHPQARLATMQRNVDWYRFWLKDEEDPDPAKAEQYVRWHELRKLQQENETKHKETGSAPIQ